MTTLDVVFDMYTDTVRRLDAAVWRSDNALVLIDQVALRRVRLILDG